MSCGQQALERASIKVDNYYASEIDKHAIQITQKNYPNTVQLGSVVNVDVHTLGKIDLLIGGSPCQSFSFAGKRKGMSTKDEIEILSMDQYLELKEQNFEFEGQSYLFWEYMRILTDLRKLNPDVKFLLENVMMGEKWEKVLSRAIGVNGIEINSSLVSAQNRRRLYWTNIGMKPAGLFGDLESVIVQPKDKCILLKDILESEVDEKYFLSDKMIASFQSHEERHKEKGTGFFWKPTEGDVKGNCLRANGALAPTDNIIIHNLMPRSSTNGNGGSGHLTRNDGKTYCLDTANSIAVEVREVRQLNKNNQSNNNTQPYQQNRIYDINGISPALQAQLTKGSTMINTPRIRRLTPTECERLQTVKDGYTDGVSDTQRYRMLGNGWTVEVIAHIFNYLNN
jgi:DNA (cytosine-5)-methyltransferase 3A